ncbi:MAG: N-methylhydantoinase A/oxoprolinase/acetone carboxylase, beta subunit [Chloroflexi bacterium]|jgi:N-methylhydantoinase A/oxoprolinase/acetone carboxylase beta subunit|nr:MAG: N-methylhydantoinase A/oxoprolinase/acetone carboxylase, beta subunit [Chloroflexota bacterium]
MRIGIDVGGTNTDAVLLDGDVLVAQTKQPTTADVTSGILSALKAVLERKPETASVEAVMLGTTHFTNALLEHKQLSQAATLRLCLPATTLLPPLIDWPDELRTAIGGYTYLVHGGHEFDGREISPLDEEEIRKAAKDMRNNGVRGVAVSGVFSPVDTSHEERAGAIIREESPGLNVTLSSEIGRVGILERENAATLNACLVDVAERTINAIRNAISSLGLDAPLFLSQNDGTLMDAEFAASYPVFTIASGPTNSMRGAAFLSGVLDGIVVDIGGTSTDGGALVSGFPREASVAVNVGGVRTNFRMPDVFSIALGGGSIVQIDPLQIGPGSVGYRLVEEGLVFGGNVLTTTDMAVVAGLADIGNSGLAGGIGKSLAEAVISEIQTRIENVVDQLKLNAAPVPVILVGGGNILVKDSLAGASDVLRPEYAGVANAIGAAIAQVGGQVEKVYSLSDVSREEALASARQEATDKAVGAGADPATVEIVEVEEVPLAYLPSNAVRVRIKAVGNLANL